MNINTTAPVNAMWRFDAYPPTHRADVLGKQHSGGFFNFSNSDRRHAGHAHSFAPRRLPQPG